MLQHVICSSSLGRSVDLVDSMDVHSCARQAISSLEFQTTHGLPQAVNDATDVHAELTRIGYDAKLVTDCDFDRFVDEVHQFCRCSKRTPRQSSISQGTGANTTTLIGSSPPHRVSDIPRFGISPRSRRCKHGVRVSMP